MLTKRQFDILAMIESEKEAISQREIAKRVQVSLGTVNKILGELIQNEYIISNVITDKGRAALEPYRVKRAVFIAAGFGSRLVPITLNTPKPLVRVKGKRIIDSLIDAVIAAGIEEIYIVRGYLAEQFDQLLYKYPLIKFVENPEYNESNNISSALHAKDFLENAYVFEADLILFNQSLISKYQYSTNYIGVKVELTDDWCLKTSNGRIVKMVLGGRNCYHMFGISYWNEQDGIRLAEHIQQVYHSPGGKERYWDQVALDYYVNEYNIYIRECSFEDIVEIDTFRELKKLDSTYNI